MYFQTEKKLFKVPVELTNYETSPAALGWYLLTFQNGSRCLEVSSTVTVSAFYEVT